MSNDVSPMIMLFYVILCLLVKFHCIMIVMIVYDDFYLCC